jgi:hypothetical protein
MNSLFISISPLHANNGAIIGLPGERPTEAMGAVAPTILPELFGLEVNH